ncbi:small muscular protein isoform X2 [Corvus hawaiiensis]|nr:small muscular protein isoform X1 [Corvus kubaryi]XP_048143710.1 small muscular protein isoform X2 [Corvus hawaiiensis]
MAVAVNALREGEGAGRACPASQQMNPRRSGAVPAALAVPSAAVAAEMLLCTKGEKLFLLRKQQRTKSFPQSQTAPILSSQDQKRSLCEDKRLIFNFSVHFAESKV